MLKNKGTAVILTLISLFGHSNVYADDGQETEVLEKKERLERRALTNPFTLLQHRRNYILPATYVSNPSSTAVQGLTQENIDNIEAKFQLSIKMPIFSQANGSGLYAAFTAVSFWQVYNADASKPFRETDYEPEVFYSFKNEYKILNIPFNELRLGFNHQSNGQDMFNSRSWNRLYAQALIDVDSTYYALKVWWRIPENEKDDELDPTGDDNPDITDYLGNFELEIGHQYKHYHVFAKWRNNLDFSDNRGALELNFNYQFTDKYEVLVQYFNGYGDSLIDYNRHQQRLGIGVQLNFI